jgi:heme O synthase-like polyprenyltransferase
MLWAYFAFSQFLIIWSGNLPEEIGWYTVRTHGTWGALILAVVILHFATPFLLLLSRGLKRDPQKLVIVAVIILVMRIIDLLWMLEPAFSREHFQVSWMHPVALVALGGLWLAMFARELSRRSLIPINDPQYESVIEQAHAGH